MRVLLAALFLSVPAFGDPRLDRIRAFEQFAETAMQAQKMPGLSVAVMHGDFRWSRGFGLADIENEVPARASSSYRMASVTKPMTAVAVLKLVEDGKIDLDAEVQTYVPYFPRKAKPVTVRQLLAHQGGISHYRDYAKEGRIREPKNTREAIAIFADFDLVNEPGTAFHYSSYGYNLLGAVIEGASGKPYGDYLSDTVWKPRGMTATRMDDPRAIIPHRVTGYVLDDGALKRSEYVDVSSRFAGGGTRSTVDDMLRFIEGLAAGKVVRRESVDLAWSAAPTRDGRYTRYGLGFGLSTRNGRWIVAHTGAQQETRTSLLFVPGERFAIALASNFEDADLHPFNDKLIELFLGDPRPILARGQDAADDTMWRALNETFQNGLAYYDRHRRPMTTDRRDLAAAFRYLRDAVADAKLVDDGRHPLAGEPLTKVGSYMASVLAASGRDPDTYHREGVLRFFADYAAAKSPHRLDRALAQRVAMWHEEWARVWTPALQGLDLSDAAGLPTLEAHVEMLAGAKLRPDFAGELVSLAERSAMRGDVATALRAASLGLTLYPRSAGVNGILGVLAVIGGDASRGRTLLARSIELEPRGYARPGNLLAIANFLARDRATTPAAVSLLVAASELHPDAENVKTRLAELQSQ